jgi:ABC-type sugar transport system permease subunit
MNEKLSKGKVKVNISYFMIFTIFIIILEGLLYSKTIKMNSLNKELHLIKENSNKIFQKMEVEGYNKSKNEIKKYHFEDVFLFQEVQDKRYPFIYNRDLKNSLTKKELKESNSIDKIIYDSCDNTNKLLEFNGKYIVSHKNNGKCYSFLSTRIDNILDIGLTPIWYILIGVILTILVFFIFIPKNKKNRIILSVVTLLYNAFFYIYSLISLKTSNIEGINEIINLTKTNLSQVFIIIMILSLLFIGFYISKLNTRLTNTILKYKTPYMYILPGGFGIALLSFAPLFSGIVLSFFRVKYGEYNFILFKNYTDILIGGLADIANPEGFYYTFFITVVWTLVNIFFHLTIGMAIALVLNKKGLKFKKIYSIIFIIPWAIPNYITALIWKSMFHKQFGSINNLLVFLGFERISWFTDTTTAFLANLFTNIWLGFPFMMVMTLGALQSIPPHLYDAAVMDGATKWQQFKYITLPMLKPALLPSIILGIIWTFNMFNVIYLVSGGEPNSSTDILITEAYRWAFERNGRYGYSAAYATIIFIVLYMYNYVTNKISNKGESK